MDALIVVGEGTGPPRLLAKARHVYRVEPTSSLVPLIADLRGRIPRLVAVWGSIDAAGPVAADLHRAGLPVELFVDGAVPAGLPPHLAGVDVRSTLDPAPGM